MLIVSFSINPGLLLQTLTCRPTDCFRQSILRFDSLGAWLQAVGPLLIVLFAFAIVSLAGATSRFAGWMTMFGGILLMVVSLIEVVFYISALSGPEDSTHQPQLDSRCTDLDLHRGSTSPLHTTRQLSLSGVKYSLGAWISVVAVLGVAFAVLGAVFLHSLHCRPRSRPSQVFKDSVARRWCRTDHPCRQDKAFSNLRRFHLNISSLTKQHGIVSYSVITFAIS